MEEKVVNNGLADQLKGQQVANEVEHVSEKALIEIVGDLSLEDKEFCEKETKQILELLSPKQFATLLLEAVTVIDLFGAEQS